MAYLIFTYPPFPLGPFASKMYTPTGSDPFDFVLNRAKTLLGESPWNSLVPDSDRLGKVMSEIRNDHALPIIIGRDVRDEISCRKQKMRNKYSAALGYTGLLVGTEKAKMKRFTKPNGTDVHEDGEGNGNTNDDADAPA